ncbi:MAG: hypothetical protein PUP91_37210 [Rhizonema sp. PD37]|nr:hypothetical protein [Rhizonema sp. PD37]
MTDLVKYLSNFRLLSIIGVIPITFIFMNSAFAGGYPGYQCFKDKARTTYCSENKVRNHAEGNAWIKRALAHFKLKGNDMRSNSIEDSIPDDAKTFN